MSDATIKLRVTRSKPVWLSPTKTGKEDEHQCRQGETFEVSVDEYNTGAYAGVAEPVDVPTAAASKIKPEASKARGRKR